MSDQKPSIFYSHRLVGTILCGGGIILTLLVQWASLVILLYPIITGAGVILFGLIADKEKEVNLGDGKVALYPLGNLKRNFRLLFVSLSIQFFFIIFWGWDAQNNPHLMDNYGMLFYLPIWLSFILGWSGLFWKIPNIILFNHDYQPIQKSWQKKLHRVLFFVDCLLLSVAIVEILLILYLPTCSGIWPLKIVLSDSLTIYGSGFSYYLGLCQFLGGSIYLIVRYRDTRNLAQKLKEQVKNKYQQERSSAILIVKKTLDHFAQRKLF